MSNVKKKNEIQSDNGNSEVFVVSGKVLGSREWNRASEKSKEENEYKAHETVEDAESVLKNSISKSRDIVSMAQRKVEQAVENAKKHGYEKGYKEGYNDGVSEGVNFEIKEKQPIIDVFSVFSKRLAEFYNNSSHDYNYTDSAFELAQRIILMELVKNDDAFYGLYKKAALHISNVEKAELKAGPRGYAIVQADKKKFEDAIEGLSELKITKQGDDDGLCILETPLGNIDASVGAQLRRAKKIVSPNQ